MQSDVIAVVAVPGVVAFDLSTPCQVFRSVRPDPYDVRVCAVEEGVVDTGSGFGLVAPYGIEEVAGAGTVIVPGVDQLPTDPAVLDALRAAAARGARIVSICTGAFVLGEAGLLDGRRATTHWRYTDELRRRHPSARIEPDVLYIDEGDLLTSAGVAAGIDLCLHIVRCDRGSEVANRVARRIVVAPHRSGGQAQFVERPVPPAARTGLAETRAWMLERLGEPLTVEAMASHAGFSPRTFARRFRSETGTTPLAWLVAERVLAARRLLESSDLPVETVASECGFGTATGLREHFRRACATTPTAYRAAFRGAVEGTNSGS